MIFFLILGLFLGAVTVIFALQNLATITVVFMAWHLDAPVALIIILAMAVGVLTSTLLSLPNLIDKSLKLSRMRNDNELLREELVKKDIEVADERTKLETNNAYLDELEKNS